VCQYAARRQSKCDHLQHHRDGQRESITPVLLSDLSVGETAAVVGSRRRSAGQIAPLVTFDSFNLPRLSIYDIAYLSPHLLPRWGLFYAYNQNRDKLSRFIRLFKRPLISARV